MVFGCVCCVNLRGDGKSIGRKGHQEGAKSTKLVLSKNRLRCTKELNHPLRDSSTLQTNEPDAYKAPGCFLRRTLRVLNRVETLTIYFDYPKIGTM